VKREIRIIGWDDAPFVFGDRKTILIGAVFRGGDFLDGIVTAEAAVDGTDATDRIAGAVNASPHRKQLRVIMLNGVTFGGFNVVDMEGLSRETGLPVIAVVRDKPDLSSMRKAMMRFPDWRKRWELVRGAGPLNALEFRDPKTGSIKKIWFQNRGIETDTAEKVIRLSSTRSFLPEPLRVAHLIGHGIGGCR